MRLDPANYFASEEVVPVPDEENKKGLVRRTALFYFEVTNNPPDYLPALLS